jgi:signal transduction histidine kinase
MTVLRAAIAEEVAATVRHDLRNKLASIRNATFYLQRKTSKTALWAEDRRFPDFFKLIDDEIVDIETIIGQRLAFAKTFVRELGPNNLSSLVERVLAGVTLPPTMRVDRSLSDVPPILCDGREARLLVRCLVDNAIESMPDGGLISIETGVTPDHVRLLVSDTGKGWSSEERERALEAFVTDKPGHAGVGLNIARRIALRYGGRIILAGGRAGGATVEVTFERSATT